MLLTSRTTFSAQIGLLPHGARRPDRGGAAVALLPRRAAVGRRLDLLHLEGGRQGASAITVTPSLLKNEAWMCPLPPKGITNLVSQPAQKSICDCTCVGAMVASKWRQGD